MENTQPLHLQFSDSVTKFTNRDISISAGLKRVRRQLRKSSTSKNMVQLVSDMEELEIVVREIRQELDEAEEVLRVWDEMKVLNAESKENHQV